MNKREKRNMKTMGMAAAVAGVALLAGCASDHETVQPAGQAAALEGVELVVSAALRVSHLNAARVVEPLA